MSPDSITKIEDLDLRDKDWKRELLKILREENMEDSYYPLSQSLLKYGQDESRNTYLSTLINLPQNAPNSLDTTFYSTLYNLVEQDLIDKSDNYLFNRTFYNESPENNLYKLKLLVFIKDTKQLSRFGDPKKINKKMFFNSNNPKSASEMREILHNWQSGDVGEQSSEVTSSNRSEEKGEREKKLKVSPTIGLNLIAKKLKKRSITEKDLYSYIASLEDLPQNLKNAPVEILKIFAPYDKLKKVLNKDYHSTHNYEELNNNLLQIVLKARGKN